MVSGGKRRGERRKEVADETKQRVGAVVSTIQSEVHAKLEHIRKRRRETLGFSQSSAPQYTAQSQCTISQNTTSSCGTHPMLHGERKKRGSRRPQGWSWHGQT